MLVVTTEQVANHRIVEVKGPVFGLTVRARGLGKDIAAAFKGLVGGEIRQYTEMLEDARKQSLDRMVQNAQAMGANAIVMMRFDSGEIGQNMSEIVAYGTAVVIEKA
ncbi:MAG: YbjQ family protein [Clostridia bacterium]